MKKEKNYSENNRDKVIEELVSNGVFKIDGKQLYELPLHSLLAEYEAFGNPEVQM
ncbi:Fur-regulated basic protein FbpA [Sporosarcina sp. PTS2304]|uniref:Fur-regulated basic protein FbpA n=1 Tax=Sporosarcina sp. PTS2304 TaxID=2283194 RepID=UPI000E0D2EFC|nr:Fur-regulated basic protein FbpA [Sporosarcina sp. PTS2304]AXH99645.1 Fur-regulated basic protein FbpA [Sporosarcina sp. PTS2304]